MKRLGIALIFGCFILGLSSCGKKSQSETSTTTTEESDETPSKYVHNEKILSLAGNIDKMPEGSQVFFASGKTKLTSIDYTEPNENYKEYNEYQAFRKSTWYWIDELKKTCISIKDDALESITELGTFVSTRRYVTKLEYDDINDELHIVSNFGSIYDIRTGYTSDGRIKIRAVKYDVYSVLGTGKRKGIYYSILDYIEDEKCVLSQMFDQYYEQKGVYGHSGHKYLIESNMKTHEITYVINLFESFGDYSRNSVKTEIQTEKDGVKYVFNNYIEDGHAQQENTFYDEDGRFIASIGSSGPDGSARLPLYRFDGWDHLYKSDTGNDITLEIGDNTYTCGRVTYSKNNTGYLQFLSLGKDYCPYLCLNRWDSKLSYSDALKEVKDYYGLTPKKDYSNTIDELLEGSLEFAKNREAFGIKDFSNMDVATFQALYDKYDKIPFSFEEAVAMNDIKGIELDEQKESYFNLDFMSGSVEGTLAVDSATYKINPKSIVITIPKNNLLSKELDYQPALLLSGTTNVIIALGNISKFDGVNSLVLTFEDTEIDLLPYIVDGSYKFELLVGVSSNEEFKRISTNLPFESEFVAGEYVLPTDIKISELVDDTYKVSTDRSLVVSTENGIVLTIKYTDIEAEEYVEPDEPEETPKGTEDSEGTPKDTEE